PHPRTTRFPYTTLFRSWASVSLTAENRAARPVGYRRRENRESTFASRSMVLTGPVLAGFIVYHLAHFTTGSVHPSFVPGDVYHKDRKSTRLNSSHVSIS